MLPSKVEKTRIVFTLAFALSAFFHVHAVAIKSDNLLPGSFKLNAVRSPLSQLTKCGRGKIDANSEGLAWRVEIDIGTPPQRLNLTLDIGSGAL